MGWFTPSHSHWAQKPPFLQQSIGIFTGDSTKIWGCGHSQEATATKFLASFNLLNHLPGSYSVLYFVAQTQAITKIILKP